MSRISLKLLIDPEENKVIFAESEKDFVDILLSFLTLPMGTIIRLLNKQSSVGCIDNIYKSVENLDTKYLNTEACKTMLLQPRSSAGILCEDLSIEVDDLKPRRLYRCPDFDCFTKKSKAFSAVAGVKCSCGDTMSTNLIWPKEEEVKQEVFLKGEASYIISDDLHVFPATVSNAITFYQRMGIDDVSSFKKRTVVVNRDMLLNLLKKLLLSKTPLTDVFIKKSSFSTDVNRDKLLNLLKKLLVSKTPLADVFIKKPCSDIEKEINQTKLSQVKLEDDYKNEDKAVVLKLVRDKNTKRVLYAEADHVMTDAFLSFLTFPLGSVVKLYSKIPWLGCTDNLYNSVDNECFVSEARMKMLLSPCLYLHYDCSHQILKLESESRSRRCRVHGCKICWGKCAKNCKHNISKVDVNEINPKMQNLIAENGGGYAKKSAKFMITNDMIITPQSLISGIDDVKDLKVSVHNLILQEVAIGEAEVMSLLKACLTSSDDVLNSVFSSRKRPRKLYN